jgi:hypothetical protein
MNIDAKKLEELKALNPALFGEKSISDNNDYDTCVHPSSPEDNFFETLSPSRKQFYH